MHVYCSFPVETLRATTIKQSFVFMENKQIYQTMLMTLDDTSAADVNPFPLKSFLQLLTNLPHYYFIVSEDENQIKDGRFNYRQTKFGEVIQKQNSFFYFEYITFICYHIINSSNSEIFRQSAFSTVTCVALPIQKLNF